MSKFDWRKYNIVYRINDKPKQHTERFIHLRTIQHFTNDGILIELQKHLEETLGELLYLKINSLILIEQENVNRIHRGTTLRTRKWEIKAKEFYYKKKIYNYSDKEKSK